MRFDVPKEGKEFIRWRYPHMSELESRIWTAFLRQTDLRFYHIQYDVKVGPGYCPDWITEENIRRMAYALTKLRIDAVGFTEDGIWIFEVKPRAGRSALGQLESYVYWYSKEFKPMKPIYAAVVCLHTDPNIKEIYDIKGIRVFEVKLPESPEGGTETVTSTG